MTPAQELNALASELLKTFEMDLRPDDRNPLTRVTVVGPKKLKKVEAAMEQVFGVAFKPAGTSAIWKNLVNSLVKGVGGIKRDQTLFQKELEPQVFLYCAFWPWESDPGRISVRVGLWAIDAKVRDQLTAALSGKGA